MIGSKIVAELSFCSGTSYRAYRMGPTEFGHLPDPPKGAFVPEGGMRPEDSQRIHLINAFRRYGYLQAELDPLGLQPKKELVYTSDILTVEACKTSLCL
ncbi:hypothetical protein COOONC_08037 [Cooperia oncophora]